MWHLKCKKPSPQPQALPLGDGSATQSCRSEAPRCLGDPARSSSSGLRGRKNTRLHYRTTTAAWKNNNKKQKKRLCFMSDLLSPPHTYMKKNNVSSKARLWRGLTFSGTIRSDSYQSDIEVLTGDTDGCLAALGGSQVAPGDTQAPVILRAVKVLHLLTGDVDHHLPDLQPCRHDGGLLGLAFITSERWLIKEMKICGGRMMSETRIW